MTRMHPQLMAALAALTVVLSACQGSDRTDPDPEPTSEPPSQTSQVWQSPDDATASGQPRPEAVEGQPYPTGAVDALSPEVTQAVIEAAGCFYDYQPADQAGPHEAYNACLHLGTDELVMEFRTADVIEPATPYELDWPSLADEELAAEAVTVTTSTSGHYGDEHGEDTEAYRHADIRLDLSRPDGTSTAMEFSVFAMLARDEAGQPWMVKAFDYTPGGSDG